MATTRLSDAIIPEIFWDYTAVDSPEKTAFYESGIVVRNDILDQKASMKGDKVTLPFWNDLDQTNEPNISTDNPASTATPDKITSGNQAAYSAFLNQGWSSADLVSELAGSDPMDRIRARVDRYWTRQWQRRLIASAKGVLADNEANDGSDMVHSVAVEDTAAQTPDTKFTRQNFTAAAFTLGDMFDSMGILALHSAVYNVMVDNEDIDFIRDSQGNLTIPTFLGHRVVVDDSMPARAGTTSGIVYTSMLFGAGAYGYGDGEARVPVEVEREAAQGDGGGIETLWTRKTWMLHPFGFEQATAPANTYTYTIAELEAAATWNRVVERKNVPVAYLVTN